MTKQEHDLILGAKIGTFAVSLYIGFLRGFEGTNAEIQREFDMSKTSTESTLRRLRDLKLIYVKQWVNIQSAVYALGDKPDANRPAVSRNIKQVELGVSSRLRSMNEARDRIDRLLEEGEKTLHGTRRTEGNVTIHRMRG
jgi:acetyl-CoA carboxylase alpha subunit